MPRFKSRLQLVDEGVSVDAGMTSVCTSNHEGFGRVLRLYARPGCTIVDPTYGNGVFWKGVDQGGYRVLATDMKRDGVDLRDLPYGDSSADMVVLDPPYRYTPLKNKRHEDTVGHGVVDGLYNLKAGGLTNTASVLELYYGGMIEAHRVLRVGGFLVVKCQDTVQDGRNIWVHCLLMHKGVELGYACRDLMVVAHPNVLKTRWDRQRHLRKGHSYFLVFRKGGHFPFGIPSVCRR